MKKIVLTIILLAPLLACNTVKPQAKNDTTTSDWTTLFDGSNMDQWRGYLMEDIPSEWVLKDGAMAFTPGPKGGKNIITKEKFTNFILSMEWKISEAGNSGIFWGVFEDEKFVEPYQTGPEIQVLDNYGHPDGKYETHTAGSLYDMVAMPKAAPLPVGEWNVCEIEINHNTNSGRVNLNGAEITFPLQGPQWDAMVADSKFKNWEGFGKFPTGHIGLQDHSDKVWFRNIRIKKLD